MEKGNNGKAAKKQQNLAVALLLVIGLFMIFLYYQAMHPKHSRSSFKKVINTPGRVKARAGSRRGIEGSSGTLSRCVDPLLS